MIDASFVWKIKRHKILAELTLYLTSAIIFGFLIALHFQPLEKNIEIDESAALNLVKYREHDEKGIYYLTTGPIFSSFHLSCYGGQDLPITIGYIDSSYHCFQLAYNGRPGVVELLIPKSSLGELSINNAYIGFYNPIPFQRVNEDDLYVKLRVELPANEERIQLSEYSGFHIDAIQWGFLVFFATLFVYLSLCWIFRKATAIRKRSGGFFNSAIQK